MYIKKKKKIFHDFGFSTGKENTKFSSTLNGYEYEINTKEDGEKICNLAGNISFFFFIKGFQLYVSVSESTFLDKE